MAMPTISYNKLWKLLIDKKMDKKDLRLAAGVSTAVIAKLGKGDNVTTDVNGCSFENMQCFEL